MSLEALASARARSYLAFDFGTRRVGVATGNALTGTATPLTTIAARARRASPRSRRSSRSGGRPRSSSAFRSTPTARRTRTRRARGASAASSKARFGLPVHEADERYTTTDAERGGAADVDAAAAAILLEQHLAGL